MFDAFASLLPLLPAALFGRRRGSDKHGEVPGGDDADPFLAFADLADVTQPGLVAADTDTEPGAVYTSAPDPAPASDLAPPDWVMGDASLDGPTVAPGLDLTGDPEHGLRPPELWHEAPEEGPKPIAGAAPFEDVIAEVADERSVWSPTAIEPTPRADAGPSLFRLNRLKRVAGPEPVLASAGGAAEPSPSSRPLPHPVNRDHPKTTGEHPAGGGRLIQGPVGRGARRRPGTTSSGRPARLAGFGPGLRATGTGGPGLDENEGVGIAAAELAPEPETASYVAAVPELPVLVEPLPDLEPSAPVPVPVLVAADGAVATGTGSIRVARPEDASASSGPDGLSVHLLARWCWAALDEVGPGLVVRASGTELVVPAGTTSLLSIDDDGGQLVVVLDGEAVVTRGGARIQLRSGALAFLPVEGDPQVDVAADDEIRADPLVALNLQLDAR